MLRSRSNCTVIGGRAERARRGHLGHARDLRRTAARAAVATDEAMVSGLAPGRVAETWIVGKSTCGRGATGRNGISREPHEQDPDHHQRGGDRIANEGCRDAAARNRRCHVSSVGRAAHAFRDVEPARGSRFQPVMPRRDDRLAGLNPLRSPPVAGDGADLHRTQLDRGVGLDDIGKKALRPALNGGARHCRDAFQRRTSRRVSTDWPGQRRGPGCRTAP